ncbi:MAG: dihydrolipoyl dehydrogenase [Pseudomonadota bacterium]
MNDKSYDVIVIGAGPAGYVCAIRCAQLGMSVACIDEWSDKNNKASPGGTCLNVGCIPSKALLDSSHHFAFLKQEAAEHGIQCADPKMDVAAMQKRKNKVVKTLTTGVKGLLKKNKVDFFHGTASLKSSTQVSISITDDNSIIQANNIVIASGSKPFELPTIPVDQKIIVDSTGALEFTEVPNHLGVIGAGVIGLEMASVWSRLGAKVTIWEGESQFLHVVDKDIANQASKIFAKQGLNVQLNSRVTEVKPSTNSVSVVVESDNSSETIEVDKLLVAIGRVANTENLNLADVGVTTNDKGFIEVNNQWKTHADNIFAIGDVVGGAMLAHKGSEEGVAVAEILAGQHGEVNTAIPWVIYTWPEISWAGATEQELQANGSEYKTGSFPFMALGRARAMGSTEGLIKFIADANTDRLLGVHILGPSASELIAEAVVAIESELSAEDLARTIHAHPTLSEGMHEAALAVDERAIHI